MEIIQLSNPKAMLLPEVQDLFRRSLIGLPLAGGDFDSAVEDFVALVTDPKAVVLVGEEEGKMVSLAIITFYTNRLFLYPQVVHLSNLGSEAMVEAMLRKGLDIIRSRGYNRARYVNASGRSDKAWGRLLRKTGKVKRIGTLMEIELA